jgi:hypothetical protein
MTGNRRTLYVQRLDLVVKMATVLEECTTHEQRSVVRFVWAKGLNAKDSHKGMFPVYDGKGPSRKVVQPWWQNFADDEEVETEV